MCQAYSAYIGWMKRQQPSLSTLAGRLTTALSNTSYMKGFFRNRIHLKRDMSVLPLLATGQVRELAGG